MSVRFPAFFNYCAWSRKQDIFKKVYRKIYRKFFWKIYRKICKKISLGRYIQGDIYRKISTERSIGRYLYEDLQEDSYRKIYRKISIGTTTTCVYKGPCLIGQYKSRQVSLPFSLVLLYQIASTFSMYCRTTCTRQLTQTHFYRLCSIIFLEPYKICVLVAVVLQC